VFGMRMIESVTRAGGLLPLGIAEYGGLAWLSRVESFPVRRESIYAHKSTILLVSN
jgi:hypothetical protein